MGAIAGGTRILYHQLIHSVCISSDEVEAGAAREAEEMRRREKLYRRGLPAAVLRDRTVVVVEYNGLATGSRMMAAVTHVRGALPRNVMIAVTVASSEAWNRRKPVGWVSTNRSSLESLSILQQP